MNTNTANLQQPPRTHKRVAGTLPYDSNIEFIGIPKTKEVVWFQYGNQHSFDTLPLPIINQLASRYFSDTRAVFDLSNITDDYARQLELYTYYVFGDADFTADVIDGQLQEAENYRHTIDCMSLKWVTKDITIDGQPLNARELTIIDLMISGQPDKAIAQQLKIHISTYDFHKRNLYKKANVQHKSDFILKIIEERIN